MVPPTRNSSKQKRFFKFKKAQFYILTAFVIVSIIFIVSMWIESYTIIDTSSVPMMEEPFVFNNIVEKAIEVVKQGKSCDDLKYNLGEYKTFVEKYGVTKNFNISLSYNIVQPCDSKLNTSFNLVLISTKASISSSFSAIK